MYAFIEGQVCEKSGGELVLMAGGVGYRILCSMSTLQAAPPIGETMRCLTILSVREDAMELFGFATAEEKTMFRNLTAVSGVGSKMALSILGSMTLRDLSLAIAMNDLTALCRAPSVGKKTAQRIALELKDKISQDDFAQPSGTSDNTPVPVRHTGSMQEALAAMQALGYTPSEAREALSHAPDPNASVDDLIRAALRAMAGM